MATLDTVVIGASAGGVETLSKLVRHLPGDLPAAVLVVMHFPESSTSVLPNILSRRGPLVAHHGVNGEQIRPGGIYVAPSGRHMQVYDDHVRLVAGPRENGNRPAIDPLFRSAAQSRGTRVMSVVLSGLLDDGTLGTASVKRRGGITLVQDPEEALFGDMPRNAIRMVNPDFVLPVELIAAKIVDLAGAPVPEPEIVESTDPADMDTEELERLERRGRPSPYVCPECHGTLYEVAEEGVPYFRCRVGHSYLEDSLVSSQAGAVEVALWSAVRALKEHTSLLAQMLENAENKGYKHMAKNYRERLEDSQNRLASIEHVLEARGSGGTLLMPDEGFVAPLRRE